MFLYFGPPDQLHSDQGRNFDSELLAETCKTLGKQQELHHITHKHTAWLKD